MKFAFLFLILFSLCAIRVEARFDCLIKLPFKSLEKQSSGEDEEERAIPINYTNDLSIKTHRHFRKNFKQAVDVRWYKMKTCVFVAFKDQNIQTEVYYSPKGTWNRTVRRYTGNELPKDIGRRLKHAYSGYNILLITEITEGTSHACYIKIEDKKSIKTIRVTESEIHEVENMTKQ
jgi:hypothetical protein